MLPFTGLRVIDVWPTRIGAQISQLFADFGADVIQVEPAGGAEIRQHAAYPFWGRGKRSIVLDLRTDADRAVLSDLTRTADVFIETQRTGVLEAMGLGYETLSAANPRLIYTSVTGFGRQGPYASAPGYEGIVYAKLGVFHNSRRMSALPDPPYVNVPFAAFAASQIGLHGVLAALIERDRSGRGQWVETNLAQAFTSLDTWAWFEHLIAERWPEAFVKADPFDANGVPASPLLFMLIVGLTEDGSWLQFASVAPHLFQAFMKACGLAWMFTDPDWQGLPTFGDDAAKRDELWSRMLVAVRSKTLAEWNDIFAADENVFAEQFRNGPVALEHPQLLHDGFTIELTDAERGPVRQPAAIVKAAATPAELTRTAPKLDEHRAEILTLAGTAVPVSASTSPAAPDALPLAGVTVLELATLFAGPHGTTMLTDLGARVIKVEPLAGDRIRGIIPFPESGGAKVMQGKESIAIDLTTAEGVAAIKAAARTADVVIQGYRAGAMARLGLDYESVKVENPDVIYVNAPGYGVDGPYGNKPAYAPSIGAATGIPLANVGRTVRESTDLTLEEIKDGARRLSAASALANAQADGFAALGVATAILFGVAARQRGAGGQQLFSSMLNTGCHAMSAQAVTYPGAPPEPAPDDRLRGTSARYRIYDAAEGYVFLAAPDDDSWASLGRALAPYVDLLGDARFADAAGRAANDAALVDVLSRVFATRPAAEWERELMPAGVAVAALALTSIESVLFDESFGRASGYLADVEHPVFESHPRLAPYIRFSRSPTRALPGVLAGSHTDSILSALGYSPDDITDLRARHIVG